jgi:LPXTG-motif cell wall-anchored protein
VKKSLWVFIAACVMLASAGIASAQAYSVVTVLPDGTVVLRGPSGVRSYQVPAGTMFTADGKANVGVADLKPGMKVTGMESGLASWHGTDVMVHQELNAEVKAKAGNSMIIRGAKGVEKYAWTDASDITIVKDGKVVDASAINVGDRITGMIVQKSTAPAKPVAVAAAPAPAPAPMKKAAPAPAPAPAAAPAPAPAPAPAAEPAPAKKLPKTATELPLAGFAGLLALGAGAGLTAIRKNRSK